MAKEDKLTIHKLTFAIQVPDKDTYMHFANRISKLCRRDLPNKLDAILIKHNLPSGTLSIRKLDIDVGKIEPNVFEKTIIDRIAKEFESFLKKNIAKIDEELKQAKFKTHYGNKFYINKGDFNFESDLIIKDSILIEQEINKADNSPVNTSLKELAKKRKSTAGAERSTSIPLQIDDTRAHENASRAIDISITDINKTLDKYEAEAMAANQALKTKNTEKQQSTSKTTNLTSATKEQKEITNIASELSKIDYNTEKQLTEREGALKKTIEQLRKIQNLDSKAMLRAIKAMDHIPEDLPAKSLSDLDRAFLYYLRYGRLPSNVKYELGTNMLDVFNVSQKDIRFFNVVKKQIAKDNNAKERLIRLADESNQKSLIKKKILETKETETFDPKTPKAYEDYFVALFFGADLSTFTPRIRRYNINDMIRFFYADHPQKLRAIISFILLKYPSKESTKKRLKRLFTMLGKGTIVKVIASFVRKAGYANKHLNQLNISHKRGIKEAHESVLLALILNRDPIVQLRKDNFTLPENIELAPRVFTKPDPEYKITDYQRQEVIDYYFTYGSIPFASLPKMISIDQISIYILSSNTRQIQNLPYFKEKKYETTFLFETIGRLPLKIVNHILKALKPTLADDLNTKYQYFKHHIKSGVSESFQLAFLLHFALLERPKSYLEEMIIFWKKQFGDDERIIGRRWKVSEDLEIELKKLIKVKEESVKDLLKVDHEFQSFSEDISVKNAGLVILWPFLKVYFKMLDLLNDDGDFRSINERARACLLLQYLAVKQSKGDELYFPLNKILTGYPLDETLPAEITMTEKEIDVSNALLKNIIRQWNALKGGTVDGFRGSFLIRDGVLSPAPEGWLLTVENKTYDILMDKMPWGIGMIKLSWAPYVLHVEWERNIM